MLEPEDRTEGWKDDPENKYDFRYWTGNSWSLYIGIEGKVYKLKNKQQSSTVTSVVRAPKERGVQPKKQSEGEINIPPLQIKINREKQQAQKPEKPTYKLSPKLKNFKPPAKQTKDLGIRSKKIQGHLID